MKYGALMNLSGLMTVNHVNEYDHPPPPGNELSFESTTINDIHDKYLHLYVLGSIRNVSLGNVSTYLFE